MKFARKLTVVLSAGTLIAAAGSVAPALAAETDGPVQDFPSLNMMMDPSGAETMSTFTVEPGKICDEGRSQPCRRSGGDVHMQRQD